MPSANLGVSHETVRTNRFAKPACSSNCVSQRFAKGFLQESAFLSRANRDALCETCELFYANWPSKPPSCKPPFNFPPNSHLLGRTFTRCTRVSLVTRVWQPFSPWNTLEQAENLQRGPFFSLHKSRASGSAFPFANSDEPKAGLQDHNEQERQQGQQFPRDLPHSPDQYLPTGRTCRPKEEKLTPNMTTMEVIPTLPWKSQSPPVSRPSRLCRK